jgi:hypothetical protein
MDIVQRFSSYAAAFETAYATNDWSQFDPFFTEDAVYETVAEVPFGGRAEGREAVKAALERSVSGLDRRFDSRSVEMLEGPLERDGAAWFRWAAIYSVAGVPPLRMLGEETAVFAGERIRRLDDRMAAGEVQRVMAFLARHGGALKP